MSVERPARLGQELSGLFGEVGLTALQHRKQANRTWLITSARGRAILKQYRWASAERVSDILRAEQLVRAAGLPVPEILHRCEDGQSVVYEHLAGGHVLPEEPELVDRCAELYAAQLSALQGFEPSSANPRPEALPYRAQQVYDGTDDDELRKVIAGTWSQLSSLGLEHPVGASHLDWRADNLLVTGSSVSGVVDWEFLGPLPAAEAVGCAAGSLTHSWREDLYRPMTLAPVLRFLQTAADELHWHGSPRPAHARVAALHTCAIRLGEDRAAGVAAITLDDLRNALEG